ncbi:MAG: cell division protein ZapE [Hyphomicrobiaceae bacterium]
MPKTSLPSYRELVQSGQLEADPAQLAAARALRQVARDVRTWKPGGSRLTSLIWPKRSATPKGLYIYGPVGSGKSMLMDLFFRRITFEPRHRYHFHEFMSLMHDRIAQARKSVDGDPIPEVGRQFTAEARLVCFDELHVTDIADAMMLGRLFKAMFEEGVVIVATSNVPPEGLYANGLNRALFVPFIEMLQARMNVLELAAAKDFRLAKLAGHELYFSPADREAEIKMRKVFERLTGGPRGKPDAIELKGRKIDVPEAAEGVARFGFADLCARPLGALDYLAIAHRYHTVMLSGVPKLDPKRKDEARRFVNLIDTLYDAGVCLIVSADAEPHELYPEGDVVFLFERTASRLTEMRSAEYLQGRKWRGEHVGTGEVA